MNMSKPTFPDLAAIRAASQADRDRLAELALGRILRLGSRPTQPGDVEEYERARAVILAAAGA
jgi:hypothetical protein